MRIEPALDITALNNELAGQNRSTFAEEGVTVVNILGSPGAGKTTLLERVLPLLSKKAGVIEGDLATAKDAARIAALGVPVVQINTDGGCHLDAKMVQQVLPLFDLQEIKLLLIENVGNLVCPASFDLGESCRVIVLSLAEGGDKPSKYPTTFVTADAVVLNKLDLLPFTDVNLELLQKDISELKPHIPIFQTACRQSSTNDMQGIEEFAAWLNSLPAEKAHN